MNQVKKIKQRLLEEEETTSTSRSGFKEGIFYIRETRRSMNYITITGVIDHGGCAQKVMTMNMLQELINYRI